MEKKPTKLLNKFAVIFFLFTIITLLTSGVMTYFSQMDTYTKLCRENSKQLCGYLTRLMEGEGQNVVDYVDYYMENYRDIEMPYDFTEYYTAMSKFVTLYTERHPNETFGVDVKLSECEEDLQHAYFEYYHEYWVLTFETAREAFGQAYTYFLIMGDPRARVEDVREQKDNDTVHNVLYMIDGERTEATIKDKNGKDIGTGNLYLGDTYGNTPSKHLVEWKTWETGKTLDEYHEEDNAWGHVYTYYTPLIIDGRKIGLVCTDVEVKSINNTIVKNTLMQMAGIAAALIICVVALLGLINRLYIAKIQVLEAGMYDFTVNKDVKAADTIETVASSDDEIGALSAQTSSLIREVDRYVKDITTMTADKERIGAELSVATKIQLDMMPKNFPKRNDIDMYAIMSPAKEVGGDFYDFFFIDSNHLGLVMADVSGKGVPAALFMVIAKTLISNRAIMGGSPARVLEDVNFSLCENNASGMFITAWFGILTLSTGNLVCANAGHEYPAVRRKGGQYELIVSDHCPPLAAMDDIEYEDETIKLEPGDSLFLYTDGIPEAKNSLGKHLGTAKMLEILNAAPDLAPYELLTGMKELIDDFAKGTDTFDDITMMCIDYIGKDDKK